MDTPSFRRSSPLRPIPTSSNPVGKNRIFDMESSCPHNVRWNDTAVEQHGKKYEEHHHISARKVFYRQRISHQRRQKNIQQGSDYRNTNTYSIGLQNLPTGFDDVGIGRLPLSYRLFCYLCLPLQMKTHW